jgi:hypothetical protein
MSALDDLKKETGIPPNIRDAIVSIVELYPSVAEQVKTSLEKQINNPAPITNEDRSQGIIPTVNYLFVAIRMGATLSAHAATTEKAVNAITEIINGQVIDGHTENKERIAQLLKNLHNHDNNAGLEIRNALQAGLNKALKIPEAAPHEETFKDKLQSLDSQVAAAIAHITNRGPYSQKKLSDSLEAEINAVSNHSEELGNKAQSFAHLLANEMYIQSISGQIAPDDLKKDLLQLTANAGTESNTDKTAEMLAKGTKEMQDADKLPAGDTHKKQLHEEGQALARQACKEVENIIKISVDKSIHIKPADTPNAKPPGKDLPGYH